MKLQVTALLGIAISISSAQSTQASGWFQSTLSNQTSSGYQDLTIRGEFAHLELRHQFKTDSPWTLQAAFDWFPDGTLSPLFKPIRNDPQIFLSYRLSDQWEVKAGRLQPYLQTDDFYQANRIGSVAPTSQSSRGTYLEGLSIRASLGSQGDYAEFFATDPLEYRRDGVITDYGVKTRLTRGKLAFTGAFTQCNENPLRFGVTNRYVFKLDYALKSNQWFRIRGGPTTAPLNESRPIGYEFAYRPSSKHEITLNLDDYDPSITDFFFGTYRLNGDSQSLTYTNWYAHNSSISLQLIRSEWLERFNFYIGSVIRF